MRSRPSWPRSTLTGKRGADGKPHHSEHPLCKAQGVFLRAEKKAPRRLPGRWYGMRYQPRYCLSELFWMQEMTFVMTVLNGVGTPSRSP